MTLNTVMAHAMADAQRKAEVKPEKMPAYLRVYRAIVALRRASPQEISAATKVPKGTVSQYLSRLTDAGVVKKTGSSPRDPYTAIQYSDAEVIKKVREQMRDQSQARRDNLAKGKDSPAPVVSVPLIEDASLQRPEQKFSPEAVVECLTLKECKQVYDYLGTFFK